MIGFFSDFLFAFVVTLCISSFFKHATCPCRREHKPYFYRSHINRLHMLLWMLSSFAYLVVHIVQGSLVLSIVYVCFSVFSWRAWWFHEKDRMQRKAKRAWGRIVVNEHGRLATE